MKPPPARSLTSVWLIGVPSNWRSAISLANGSLAMVSWYLIDRACLSAGLRHASVYLDQALTVLQGLGELVLEKLTGRCRWQGVEHDDLGGPLVRGELRLDPAREFVGSYPRSLNQLHEGDDLFVAFHRPSNHSGSHDVAVRIENRLNLRRIDIEA